MAQILSGNEIAQRVRSEIRQDVEKLAEEGVTPGLAVIVAGSDPASEIYVRNKDRACAELGIESRVIKLSEYISQAELISIIEELNVDNAIDGILVQMPLPGHIDSDAVIEAINPSKDVDGFHPLNVGALMTGKPRFVPCTPKGVMRMLKECGAKIQGAHAVVVGRSNIVGKPMAMLLLHEHATVTICHSRTKDLASVTKNADILICAVGQPHFITADMVKPGAIVIDVGINRSESGKIVGDVDFEAVEPIAKAITPVPGGVGVMTVAMLMENTAEAARRNARLG